MGLVLHVLKLSRHTRIGTSNHDLQQDRRIIGRRGARHGSIIYPHCAARLFGGPRIRLTLAVALRSPARRSGWITTPPPTGVGPGPPTPVLRPPSAQGVASSGHLEATVSQLPGLAAVGERARCDSLASPPSGSAAERHGVDGEQGTLGRPHRASVCAVRYHSERSPR